MKKARLLLIIKFAFISSFIFSQNIDILDPNFKQALIDQGIDSNGDGEIQVNEAEIVKNILINDSLNITNVAGLASFKNIETLTIANNPITYLDGYVNQLTKLKFLYVINTSVIDFQIVNNEKLVTIYCTDNPITNVKFINLPSLIQLTYRNNAAYELDVSELTNLTSLGIDNNFISSINLSNLTNLGSLDCSNNMISELDLTAQSNLTSLTVNNNNLSNIDLSNLDQLISLRCGNNSLTDLDLNGLTTVRILNCNDNEIDNLDLAELSNITRLDCSNNNLNQLELAYQEKLQYLYCNNNKIEHLDISSTVGLNYFYCQNNLLTSIVLKNGFKDTFLNFRDNPNLSFICADEFEVNSVNFKLSQFGIEDCFVTSDCNTIVENGIYTLSGQVYFGFDCDTVVSKYSYPKLRVYDGIDSLSYYGYANGNYNLYLDSGSYEIKYDFDLFDKFEISPEYITINFPEDSLNILQDFCITPIGEQSFLEIVIIPQDQARPGFESSYKLVIKNIGNTVIPFDLTFAYKSDLMDLISSSLAVDDFGVDTLRWQFEKINPFEEKKIELTFQLNTPIENPPLNDGDILHLFAEVEIEQPDEQPVNNIHNLNQLVVNSFDPNDKACLEGNVLSPDMIGDFVHYMVRFENTGSADAIDIVVKDEIDTSSFELSTLQVIDASHDLETHITKDNIVEFIFKDIYLPYEDEANDGYLVFKIKTKNDLELGDTLRNIAEIYFDFNYPVITNIAETSIEEIVNDNDMDGFSSEVDCNDNDPLINPNSEETCDDIDNNCDGSIDEALEYTTYYIDSDNDGYGDELTAMDYCNEQSELVTLAGDCNDENSDIFPGAEEIPNNNIDEDCNGTDLITGIHELLNSKIRIFPNPVHDLLYIDVVGQLNYRCSLYDLTGKIILTSKNQKSIPLDSILEGTYLLELKDLKTGQKIIERIVITK